MKPQNVAIKLIYVFAFATLSFFIIKVGHYAEMTTMTENDYYANDYDENDYNDNHSDENHCDDNHYDD